MSCRLYPGGDGYSHCMAKAAKDPAQEHDENKQSPLGAMVWRVFSVGSTVVATKVAGNVASKGWKLATGKPVPMRGDYENEKTRDVVAYTALLGMLMAGIKVGAERKAAEYYRQSTGHLPKALGQRRLTARELRRRRRLSRAMARAQWDATHPLR